MPPVEDPKEVEARHQRYLHFKEMLLDANRRATELGLAALKTAMLINGAAAIALLAFTSQIASKGTIMDSKALQLLDPLKLLVGGVFAAALAVGFGYLRMFFETLHYNAEIMNPGVGKKWVTAASASLYIAIVLSFASYVIFGVGMFQSADALAALITQKK